MYNIEAKPGFEKDRLKKLYSAAKLQKYTDIIFTVRDRSICAHLVILAACSEIFINENVDKLNSILARFDDVVIDAILKYCYTGVINIEENLYENFKDLATQLEIYNLYYKRIDVKNSLESLTFSNDPASIETAMYFALENFEKLYKTPDFLNLPFSALIEIIRSDYLCVSSEAQVMASVRMWVEKDDDKRRSKLKELLSFIKLPGLTMEINLTEVLTGYYSSSEYTKMVKKAVEHILKRQKNSSQRWNSLKIVLIVGNTASGDQFVEVFDSKKNSWTGTIYNFKRHYFGLVLVDDWILIIGGSESSKVEYLDLKDGEIRILKPMRQNRWRLSAVAIYRNMSTDVYVIGGQHFNKDDGVIILSSVERWNSKSMSWDFVAPLLRPVYSHSATVIDDRIYVTGGRLHDGAATNKVQMYSKDVDFSHWSYCASMKQSRYDHSSVTINGKLYVAGGMSSENILDTVELFDPKANLWTIICLLPSARSGISICNFRNKLLCLGGMDSKGSLLYDVIEYDDKNKIWKIMKNLNHSIFVSPFSAFVVPYDSVLF